MTGSLSSASSPPARASPTAALDPVLHELSHSLFVSARELEEDEGVSGLGTQGQKCPKRSTVCGQMALTKQSHDGRAKTKEFQSGVDRTDDFLKLGVKQTRGTQLEA